MGDNETKIGKGDDDDDGDGELWNKSKGEKFNWVLNLFSFMQ